MRQTTRQLQKSNQNTVMGKEMEPDPDCQEGEEDRNL
jgi:hypothetical protein